MLVGALPRRSTSLLLRQNAQNQQTPRILRFKFAFSPFYAVSVFLRLLYGKKSATRDFSLLRWFYAFSALPNSSTSLFLRLRTRHQQTPLHFRCPRCHAPDTPGDSASKTAILLVLPFHLVGQRCRGVPARQRLRAAEWLTSSCSGSDQTNLLNPQGKHPKCSYYSGLNVRFQGQKRHYNVRIPLSAHIVQFLALRFFSPFP